ALTPDREGPGLGLLVTGLPLLAVSVDDGVVVDPTGRLWVVNPLQLATADPLPAIRRDQDRIDQQRLVTGWTRHAAVPLLPVPAAADLLDQTPSDDRAYAFDLRTAELTAERR